MIHHVYANRSNVGDWISARGIQQLMPGHPIVDHFCDAPFVEATLDALSRTSESDLVLVGGGGLFMDYFAPFWEGLLRAPPRAPLCLWGVGLCDIKAEASRPDRQLVRAVARRALRCHVRDAPTRDFLGLADLPPPTPCPGLAAIEPVARGSTILHVDNYTTAGADTFDRMDSFARSFADESGRAYRRTNNRIDGRVSEAALESVLDLYRASDIVLSSALHGCVIGVAMGRPVVAVSGDWKIEGFMDAMGLADWVLDVSEVERVPDLLERAAGQSGAAPGLAAARAANRAIAADLTGLIALSNRPALAV